MSESPLLMTEQQNPTDQRPGHRLAEARQAKGLSLEEVASQLRLNVSMLQALENDDYSRLPPAAYVAGYVRSYARALGMSEAELTRSTGAAPSGEPPIVGVVARGHAAQVQASDPRVRIVSYLLIGGLLLISSAWWLVQSEGPAAPEQEIAAVPPAEVEAPPAVGEPPLAGTPGVAELAPTIAAPAASSPVTVAAVPPAAKPDPVVQEPAKTPASEAPPKPEAPPPPELTAAMPQSIVALDFTEECWVDVVDAAGRQIAYELAPAGRKMKLRGEAPFKVFFGYSPGVQVTFNDQLFDHRPFARRDVARFKLGTAEDNALLTEAQ